MLFDASIAKINMLTHLGSSHKGNKNLQASQCLFSANTKSTLKLQQHFLDKVNQPILTSEHLTNRLSQFDPQDRPMALKLIHQIDYHAYPDLCLDVKNLHQYVLKALQKDGFTHSEKPTFENVDFSRIYTAKSGDLISVIYRKINKIRGVLFHNTEELRQNQASKSDRALVLLDDYICTGTQVLGEFYAMGGNHFLKQYPKIYLAVITAHQKAIQRFDLLKQGKTNQVATEIIQEFRITDKHYQTQLKKALKTLALGKIELIALHQELPLLSPDNKNLTSAEKAKLKKFLEKYNVYKYPFGITNAQGHTAFFYSVPNTLPDMLWNTKSKKPDGTPWLPLFHRTEDISYYEMSQTLPPEKQVW